MKPLPLLVLVLLAISLLGCSVGGSVGSSSGMASYGTGKNGVNFQRTVKFQVSGGGGITSAGNTATVTFAKGKLLIEEARILLNGKLLAAIPQDAKEIDVNFTGNKLTIKADGASVYQQ
jgi:uncharacterized protein (DUF697 family)